MTEFYIKDKDTGKPVLIGKNRAEAASYLLNNAPLIARGLAMEYFEELWYTDTLHYIAEMGWRTNREFLMEALEYAEEYCENVACENDIWYRGKIMVHFTDWVNDPGDTNEIDGRTYVYTVIHDPGDPFCPVKGLWICKEKEEE
jgi:hypothetical protein